MLRSKEEKSSTTDKAKESVGQEKTQENQGTKPGEIAKEESQNKKLDAEKLKTLVASNDLDGVYDQLKNVKAESVSSEDTQLYNKAIKLMKSEGVSKFYDYGLWYFNQG